MPSNNKDVQFRCTIKYMFKGCPKKDGWFGCFATKDGEDIRLTGKTMQNLAKGMQLDVTGIQTSDDEYTATDITVVTKTSSGTKAYLASLPGVSDAIAKLVVQKFGSDAIQKIKDNPTLVKNTVGLSEKQINALTKGVTNTDDVNQIRTFLPELRSDAINYIKKNISSPKQQIQNNPWLLLNCPHTSFKTVDAIAIRLGIDIFDPDRIERGIAYTLEIMQTGDNYINLSDDTKMQTLMYKIQDLLHIRFGNGMTEFGNILMRMSNKPDPKIHIRPYQQEFHLYTTDDYNDYVTVRDQINRIKTKSYITTNEQAKRLLSEITNMNKILPFKLTDEQKNAVIISMSRQLSIITGGPGRGKTLTISCIADCNVNMPRIMDPNMTGRKGKVLLLAPTGRAAKKLREDTGDKYETMTIDKLICSVKIPPKDETKKGTVQHNSQYMSYNTEDALIIVDESSMIDMPKIAELFRTFRKPRYCFVGDKDQLPPVGKGRFFQDLITCGKVATATLTIPLRNNGIILQNADLINQGDTALTYDIHEMPLFPQLEDNQTALDFIIDQYNDECDLEPDKAQIALICPIKRGEIGVTSINIALQALNCPENQYGIASYNAARKTNIFSTKGFPIPDTYFGNGQKYTRFRIGDIVMCTKSNYSIELTKYENDDFWNGKAKEQTNGIFNGDVGKIIGYIASNTVGNDTDSDFIIVQMNNGYVAELDRSDEEFDHFVLGYAMTVHKVQGCEYNTVIYISPKSLKYMTGTGFACRNLAYTAITRAKHKAVIIGSKESLNLCIQTPMSHRNSTLAEELK